MVRSAVMVTGAPRSGTTFLGKMLALDPKLLYVDEPFNIQTGLEGLWETFPYADALARDESSPYDTIVNQLLNGKATFRSSVLRPTTRNPIRKLARSTLVSGENVSYKLYSKLPTKQHYLIKDPMACFLSEYLHREYDMSLVVIMRHPCATVASYKRLGWHYDLQELVDQPGLAERHLGKLFRNVDIAKLGEVEAWAYLWLAIYHVLEEYKSRNKEVLFITHEQLAFSPKETLSDLYSRLGLTFRADLDDIINTHTNAHNPAAATNNMPHVLKRDSMGTTDQWKQILSRKEVATIKKITSKIASKYYPSSSWRISTS